MKWQKNMTNGKEVNYLVINFDLSTERLKQCYTKSRRSAYREIQSFLENNGFEHRQYSGYVSHLPMDSQEIPNLIHGLNLNLPWVKFCVNEFDFSEVKHKADLDAIRYFFDLPKEYAKEHNAETTAKTKDTLERS